MPRLFIALTPPLHVLDALIDTMEAVDNARWQDEDQMHLTLCFAGKVKEDILPDLVDALDNVPFAPFDITLSGTGHFERKGLINSMWARVEPVVQLMTLQSRVTQACRAVGLEIETRKFTPHITLARFSHPSADIAHWMAKHSDLKCAPFRAEHFALYESHLSDGPARYEELARFPA